MRTILFSLFALVACNPSDQGLVCDDAYMLPNAETDDGPLSGPVVVTAHFTNEVEAITFSGEPGEVYAGTLGFSVNRSAVLEMTVQRFALQFAIDIDADGVFNAPSERRSPSEEHFVRDKVLGCSVYDKYGNTLSAAPIRPSPTSGMALVDLALEPGAAAPVDESIEGLTFGGRADVHILCELDEDVPGVAMVRFVDPTPESFVVRNANNWPVDTNPGANNGVYEEGKTTLVQWTIE